MNVKSTVEKITPEQATQILEEAKINVQNRPVQDRHVDWLAQQMTAGKWVLNGEAIILDDEGQLLDGQHRLWAVMQSGMTIESLVTRGVDRRGFATIDTGKARTVGAVLGIVGEKYAVAMAATLGLLHRHSVGKMLWGAKSAGFTSETAITLARKHPGLRDAMDWANSVRKNIVWQKVPVSVNAFDRYMFIAHDPIKAARFFDLVGDAVSDEPGTATRLLRDWYFRREGSKDRRSSAEVIAVTVKAWTAYLSGRKIATLRWSQGGQYPESFPPIPGFETPKEKIQKTLRRAE